MTPLLVLVFGVAPVTAVGTDLLFAALTKTGGAWAHTRRGNVAWNIVGWLAAGSVPASAVTLALLDLFVPDPGILSALVSLALGFALILIPGALLSRDRLHVWSARGGAGGGLETAGAPPHRLVARHLARQRAQPEDSGTGAARCARCDAGPYRRQARVIAPMYRYDEIDQKLVDERVAQFRDQTRRFLAGKLSDDEFRALRLRNGLYIQRYAPMLRIAIPYGLLSTRQLRKLAHIARKYDRGYGHFSTRQNLQLNWPKLERVPDILAELATVQMHAIQTSGNSFRNITTDHFAGVAQDEIVDSFVWCEIIRQWSTFHPEFSYLPRKFKFAVNGAKSDRAAVAVHDIGLHAVTDEKGEVGFRALVGGGLGRTPAIGFVIREFLPWRHLLTYIEAILRVYNRYGRRDT